MSLILTDGEPTTRRLWSPPAIPSFGHAHLMAPEFITPLRKWTAEFGPNFALTIFGVRIVVTSDADAAEKVMAESPFFTKKMSRKLHALHDFFVPSVSRDTHDSQMI
ncbi:hypothetical protein AMAG_03226 [Allomyces macrogynus ATCC 38327]|uniref:Cytochrome P450 n=1 Tax=Allomyces macrogynus (strain ATCC 38327) TaxID=578462 RepID=A0A0L0S4S6_ALLM3|nr:hypothetical protein AMAG_03226 [Allomyces macrogynus ATCC 38327]|eukprot:KNE57523.1 hypothetical protein AMAG_03226 [Allomyces macrogynus ATCC 38327]